jgi:acyl-[acyl-carrier-protein]-phospholipid O-acyltransferase/long-chain-fatty-acid--[acyl-carrier-protein] ligase
MNKPLPLRSSDGNDPGPLLFGNRSFLFFLVTQALGALNDNVLKQLVLLLGVGYTMSGIDYQAAIQFLFAIPFLLFSGIAGDISDRYSKGWLMTLCKKAEILVACAAVGALLFAANGNPEPSGTPLHLWLLAIVCFVMGTQSTFFAPAKYGGLPQLVREEDLAPATGLTQMTTFLAIIFGVALAGILVDVFADSIYVGGLIAIGIALLGTLTSRGISRHPAADPDRRIGIGSFTSVLPNLADIIRSDQLMFRIMLAYSWFWFVGGIVLTSINALGRLQLGLNNFETSLMVAVTSIGIAVGSMLVGKLSRGKVRLGLSIPGVVLLIICLGSFYLVPLHTPSPAEMELVKQLNELSSDAGGMQVIPRALPSKRYACMLILFLLGTASGFYSVPLLAFIQARPSRNRKGQVFAAVNWLNWIFIVGSAAAYGLGITLVGFRANLLLASLGPLTLLVAGLLVPGIVHRLRKEKPVFVHTAD